MEKKFYSDVRFIRAENLKGRAKEVAEASGIDDGLVILRASASLPPQYEIERVMGDPLERLKEIGKEEGITQKVLNHALEGLLDMRCEKDIKH